MFFFCAGSFSVAEKLVALLLLWCFCRGFNDAQFSPENGVDFGLQIRRIFGGVVE